MDNQIERYKRQIDIVSYNQLNIPIHIIGCGGIGSWTTLMLAKMGCSNITIYDFDEVEDHNVSSQFFKESQLGLLKTDALVANVYEQTGIAPAISSVESEEEIQEGLVIIAVDSMAMRWKLNHFFKDKNITIIDARMGGLQAELYCVKAGDYEPTLVAIESVDHEICTAKAISFNCGLISSLVANYVRLFVNNKLDFVRMKERTFLFDTVTIIK